MNMFWKFRRDRCDDLMDLGMCKKVKWSLAPLGVLFSARTFRSVEFSTGVKTVLRKYIPGCAQKLYISLRQSCLYSRLKTYCIDVIEVSRRSRVLSWTRPIKICRLVCLPAKYCEVKVMYDRYVEKVQWRCCCQWKTNCKKVCTL